MRRELKVLLGRHESANINPLNRLKGLGYWLNTYNPGLSEKGAKGAEATAPKLYALLYNEKVAWLVSGMRRAIETLEILTQGFGGVVMTEEVLLRPAFYDDVPPRLIYQANEADDDSVVYKVWIGTNRDFWETWTDAVALATMITRGYLHAHHGVEHIVMMSHYDKVAMILCAVVGDDPLNFEKYLISRGEFVQITVSDGGKPKVEKIISKES